MKAERFHFLVAQRRVGLRDVARHGEHDGDGVFRRGDGVARGRVDHGDAPTSGGVQVHVVHAHAGPAHHLKSRAGLDDGGGDLRFAADDEGVGVRHGLEELPLGHAQPPLDGEPRLRLEDVHPLLVDGISDEDLHVSHCLLLVHRP